MKSLLTLSALFLLLFASCRKDAENTPQRPKGNCRISKLVQGFPGEDTTFNFLRNQDGAITGIEYAYRSSHYPLQHDTLHIVLDNEGHPSEMYDGKPYNEPRRLFGWDWNAQGILIGQYDWGGRYLFSYTSDTILADITYSSFNQVGGRWWPETAIELEFDEDGDIIAKKGSAGWNYYTYYDLPNTIAEFLQYNTGNHLGMDDLMVYPFCVPSKKLLKRIQLQHNLDTYDITYEFNENNQVVKAKSFATRNGEVRGTFTRSFYYECD